jgi:sestrin
LDCSAGGTVPYRNSEISQLERTVYPSDFTWRDHGYSFLDRLCPSVADLVADSIQFVASMTFRTFSDEQDIDTEPLRRAIWKYTHRVYGLAYDDYNYKEVDLFLRIGLRKYLRKVGCAPHTLTREDYDSIDISLKPHELVHVNLLLMEARVEAQLLYAMAAIEQTSKGL